MLGSGELWRKIRVRLGSPVVDLATDIANLENGITDAVPNPPTANSLQDVLHKDGSYTFNNTTDSLEAIRDKINVLLSDYDPPTRTEATQDKNAIITQVDANETRINLIYNLWAVAVITQANTTSQTYVDVVNISNRGTLTGITQQLTGGSGSDCQLKVIIDGSTKFDDVFQDGGVDGEMVTLSFHHRFNSSLQVQHLTVADIPRTTTIVAYTTD